MFREESNRILRSLVDRVEIRPKAKGNGVDAVLYGDLAQILAMCEMADKKKRPSARAEGRLLSVVAGTGFLQARTDWTLRKFV